jgi:hypothetical protein
MRAANLFTMLSAYQPGSTATPFENYCTSGLAYLLNRGHHLLTALFREAAKVPNEMLADVEVQPRMADAGLADMLLTFEGGRRIVVEVEVEPGGATDHFEALERVAHQWEAPPAFVTVGLKRAEVKAGWAALSWLDVAEAIEDDPDPLVQDFHRFVMDDVLGLGVVPLEEAMRSNRLYALGGAAVRRHFGDDVAYANAVSRPMGSRYRYIGTMFSITPGGEMDHWIGMVNETVPLGEHYQLVLASKTRALKEPSQQPRALGDWKWTGWTGLGRVVRPVSPDAYDTLMERARP